MSRRIILLPPLALLLGALACVIPGATSPTPFAFPTPNQTLTAIFAPTATPTEAAATDTPAPAEATPTASGTPLVLATTPAGPTATVSPLGNRPNGTPITATLLTLAPAIDGDLSDWKGGSYTVNACTYGCTLRTGDADLSGVFFIGYDASNLYLGVQVKDDTYVQVAGGHSMFKGDDVEIQLDANLSTDFNSTSMTSDDYQIGLSAGNFGTLGPQAYRWYPSSLAGNLSTVTVKGKRTSDGYTLEAKIPWQVFGVTATSGSRFGFALSISDDDTPGTAIQQSMVSSVGTRKLLNPTTWGTLILGPAGGS